MTKDTEHTFSIIDQLFEVIKKYKDTDNPVVRELCDILGVEAGSTKMYQVSQTTLSEIKRRKSEADNYLNDRAWHAYSRGLGVAIQAIEQDRVD